MIRSALALAAIVTGFADAASAQTLVKVSPKTFTIPAQAARRITLDRFVMKRQVIPLDLVARASQDMTGWTAVTKGGASGSPVIIPFPQEPLLGVRAKDKNFYVAPVDLMQPAMIDSGVWGGLWPGISALSCTRDRFTMTTWASADCIASTPNGEPFVGGLIYDSDPLGTIDPSLETATAVPNLFLYERVPLSGKTFAAPVAMSGRYGSVPGSDTSADARPALAWDGGMGLWSVVTPTASGTAWNWQKLPFSAFAAPACGVADTSASLGHCLFGDGAGNAPTLYAVTLNGASQRLVKVADLPPPPGGGSMAKGEAAVAVGDGIVHLFMRGRNGHLYATQAKVGTADFPAWVDRGGYLAVGSVPSCVRFKGGATCAIRGEDNRIYVRRMPGTGSSGL